jgi:3-oxoacyl-(acyl-carrier-protein) synthase
MRRVVVTGMGAVSCLGNSADEITDSLKNGRSGIVYNENFKEMGLRSHHRFEGTHRSQGPSIHERFGGVRLYRHAVGYQ